MESDQLNIHDNDPRSEGGPPGWLAWSVILAGAVVIVVTVLIVGVFF